LFVRTYPDLGAKLTLGTGTYRAAVWSEDGAVVYGFDADGVDAFSISRVPRLEVKARQRILDDLSNVHWPNANPGPLGGFYVLEDVPGAGIITSIEVVTNWVQNLPQ
jgi:hypothetical protein